MTEIKEADFNLFIAEGDSVVDFYAEWCGPCSMMTTIMESCESKNSQVKFAKVNIDYATNIVDQYKIMNIPCIIFFKDGKDFTKLVGLRKEKEVQEIINTLNKPL